MFTVTIEGLEDVARKWANSVREIHDGATEAVIRAADAGVEEGKRSATWTDRTGAARRTIKGKSRCLDLSFGARGHGCPVVLPSIS